jgi:pterin-4a-carbinolamine dehydratase
MTKLIELMRENLISQHVTVPSHTLPVKVSDRVPILPANRWLLINKSQLVKLYRFVSVDARNDFVNQLFVHENNIGHRAKFVIALDADRNPTVELTLSTPGVDVITELDKEFAKFADLVYRDTNI